MINVVAVGPKGATAHAMRTVVFDFVPGTLVLDFADPNGDDNGPGTYAYPTSADFHAGAFDIQRFQIYDAGSDVVFRLQTRDLTPTFGSPLGAQLVDVYVHRAGRVADVDVGRERDDGEPQLHDRAGVRVEPAVAGAGLRPALPGRERRNVGHDQHLRERDLALHHVQGLEGVARRDAGEPAGRSRSCSPARTASRTTRRAASSRRRRTSSSASARRAASAPICSFNPGLVPKAVDVLTPPGVSQATELDPTLGPVVLQGVTIP